MRAVVVYPGPEFSVTDVADKLAIGLASNGIETTAFRLHDMMAFYTNAYIKADDGSDTYLKAFSVADSVQLVMDQLKAELWKLMPDLVFVVSGFFTDHDLLDRIRIHPGRHRVIGVLTEQPYELPRELEFASHCDVAVLNDPTHLEQFHEVTPSIYLPHSFNPDVHHPNGRTDRWDFSFIGTGYPSRIRWFEKVDYRGARVAFAGNWEALDDGSPLERFLLDDRSHCMDNADTAGMYRASAMSVNLYRREHDDGADAVGWAMGPREVELAACGTFFARDPRPESDAVFPMLPTVTDPSELSDVLAWSMTHPDERQEAADLARAAVAHRDCVSAAAELLRFIGV